MNEKMIDSPADLLPFMKKMERNDENTGDVAQCDLRDNPPCPTFSEVWDSPMIEKYNDPTSGQKRWRCHHCKLVSVVACSLSLPK